MSSKWNPFNAVAPGSDMVKEVMKEKNKIKMPILSEDQKMAIQERLFESFNNQEIINITYFKGGNMYSVEGIIEKIDINSRKIVINSDISVFFSQIYEIS
jgi:hypothetical protein